MENDIIQEFFQECERQVVVPVLTMQEVPYKNLENFFARFGIYEKFKEYINENFESVNDLQEQIEKLEDENSDYLVEISETKSDIENLVKKLEKKTDINKEEILKELNRIIF